MVGAGRHLTSRGTFEPYKVANVGGGKKKKCKLLQRAADSMASSIACCDSAFHFFKGTNQLCCAHSPLSYAFLRAAARPLDTLLQALPQLSDGVPDFHEPPTGKGSDGGGRSR